MTMSNKQNLENFLNIIVNNLNEKNKLKLREIS